MEYVVDTSVHSVIEYTRFCIMFTLWQYIVTLFSMDHSVYLCLVVTE